MPYKSFKDVNPALKGIKPKITLSQANLIAKWADAMERAEDGPESAWAAAIAQFKKLYRVEGGKWVKRKVKESSMSEYKAYTTSTNSVLISVNAIDVDGEAVPVAELVAAYAETSTDTDGSEEGQMETGGVDEESDFTEAVAGSLEDYAMSVKDAFRVAFKPITVSSGVEVGPDLWPRDVFKDNPDLGDVVVVRGEEGQLYAVEYNETDEGFEFATRENWRKVVLTYVPVKEETAEVAETQLSESASGHALALAEAQAVTGGPRAPLLMDVVLIKPGWGNKKDRHYYSRKVLKRDAKVFEGIKMYTTDHRPGEKSVRTEVSVIKGITGFTDDGSPVAQVAVHDPDFAEATRNRAKLGTLDSLECSILATGRTKKGEVDGEKGNIVEAITRGQSVDWVTKAGAGGHALNLAENNAGGVNMEKEKITELLSESELSPEAQERLAGAEYEDESAVEEAILQEQEKEQAQREEAPQKLEEAEVAKLLSETNLSSVSRKRLAEGEYEDESALREAIMAEIEYVKKLTGSGQPFAQGGGTALGEEQMSEADYDTAYTDILRRHGLHVPQQQEVT